MTEDLNNNDTNNTVLPVKPVKKKLVNIDGELFWQIFALIACIAIMYMAIDYRHAVDMQVSAITNATCAKLLAENAINKVLIP